MDGPETARAVRAIADIRAQAFARRGYVRCCHGRDTAPRAWTTLFRFLKGAYRRGLRPDHARDLAGCPCPNSDGYDAVMQVAYECGMVPEYEHIAGCVSPNAIVAAYRHGMPPRRAHFSAFDDGPVVPVLAAAYAAGYAPDPDRDFHGREWDDDALLQAWTDAVEHGARVSFATIVELGDYALVSTAYARGGLAAHADHVPDILEHDETAMPHAYRAGLPFDFDCQVAVLTDASVAADALVAAYACGAHPEQRHMDAIEDADRPRVMGAVRRRLRREHAVVSVFGRDVGGTINLLSATASIYCRRTA